MARNKQIEAFFALLRSGLWEQEVELQSYEPVDFDSLYELADEQAVVGLIGAGLEHITDTKVQKMQARPFLTRVFSIEQRNEAMNDFIARLFDRFQKEGITAVLVKGQGVAQCYARPQWRAAGDIDLFLDDENYEKAKALLTRDASRVEDEAKMTRHLGMTLDDFEVELHGTLNTGVTQQIDDCQLTIQEEMFRDKRFRVWQNGSEAIPLPNENDDILFVFIHLVKHFYKKGIGLRQICDWCRLLWTYRGSIDHELLVNRLTEMDILSEWKAFASLAVNSLGMPKEGMPLYDSSSRFFRKARRILDIVLQKGNFGQNEDKSYYQKHSYFIVKAISFFRWIRDYSILFLIFPKNSWLSFRRIFVVGATAAIKGE